MRIAFVLIAAAAALPARAEAPRTQGGQKSQAQTRTIRVEGGYIRYEVLPGDDQLPPGQVFLVGAERPVDRTEGAAPGRAARGRQEAPRERGAAEPQRGHAESEKRDGLCQVQQSRLAARLLELKGLSVPEDIALWLQQNPHYFAGSGRNLLVSVFQDPTLATMIQSDFPARGYAEDLARCEGAQARR